MYHVFGLILQACSYQSSPVLSPSFFPRKHLKCRAFDRLTNHRSAPSVQVSSLALASQQSWMQILGQPTRNKHQDTSPPNLTLLAVYPSVLGLTEQRYSVFFPFVAPSSCLHYGKKKANGGYLSALTITVFLPRIPLPHIIYTNFQNPCGLQKSLNVKHLRVFQNFANFKDRFTANIMI